MTARFYVPHAQAEGELVNLPEDEAVHLTRVLRLKSGDSVIIFDGRGRAFQGLVESTGKTVSVRVGKSTPAVPETRIAVTLAQAVLKGDKMDHVIRDAVMIGVAAILPVVSVRSEVTLATLERGRRQERWQRIAVSSAKQCGRAVVPQIKAPVELERIFDAGGTLLMLVEPSVAIATTTVGELAMDPPAAVTLIVGPEGGWTGEEVSRAEQRCTLVRLGARTLRADAVPIVALTALFTIWKQFE